MLSHLHFEGVLDAQERSNAKRDEIEYLSHGSGKELMLSKSSGKEPMLSKSSNKEPVLRNSSSRELM